MVSVLIGLTRHENLVLKLKRILLILNLENESIFTYRPYYIKKKLFSRTPLLSMSFYVKFKQSDRSTKM